MAQMYPGYLQNQSRREKSHFPIPHWKILRMQAEGDSMNKIAGQLGLAEVTVKYHCRETYRKLGVNGKAAAVNEARKRKLI
ncbi:MAG: response regulator transcription factor [Lachnospiraceae bacterium]